MNIIEHLYQAFLSYLQNTYHVSPEQLTPLQFELNTEPAKQAFGDISTNAALVLAKQLGRNPRDIANQIKNEFQHPEIEKLEIAGPGFLNIFLKSITYQALASDIFNEPRRFFASKPAREPKRYNLEFVSANPTGPLHLGHGRGGIIGDVLGNILRFLGHQVTKEFYINDAGSQIQKLAASFKARCQQALGLDVQMPADGYHGEYLIELAKECLQHYNHLELLHKADEFFVDYAKTHMLEHIKKTLEAYGIVFDVWFSEKKLHESKSIPDALKRLSTNGYTYEHEEALWFKSTAFGDDKDRVLCRQNGEYTYVAADVAYLENKIERGFDHLIMVLGQDHHSYVVRLKGLLQALGHNRDMLDIILYQLVTLKEGGELIRMSKRAGKIVLLEDVIEIVGKDVARFFYLNRKADAHLDFDIALALKRTEENPVFYIQYAYVRTKSILEKAAHESGLERITAQDVSALGTDEFEVLRKIVSLNALLSNIGKHYQTHLLAYYTHELAATFHRYYSKNRVIDSDNKIQSRSRLALVHIVKNTLEVCLNLLGLSLPEKM